MNEPSSLNSMISSNLARISSSPCPRMEPYKRAFSREPKDDEMKTAIDYINKKTQQAKKNGGKINEANKMAYEDLVWALLNTKEFLFNH